jgi:hypothetical protein
MKFLPLEEMYLELTLNTISRKGQSGIKTKKMIGIIWNCSGVAKKGMGIGIKDLLLEHKVDFVGLQETMKKKYTKKFFRTIDPSRSYAWLWLPSKGGSRWGALWH